MPDTLSKQIDKLLSKMSLTEKAGLLGGAGEFNTRGYKKYKIPEMILSDGPHGMRHQEGAGDHLGLAQSLPATCFPSASILACSWDPENAEKVGATLAEEAAAQKVGTMLGPGLNMKRSPLCGRNFEYFSEDPILAGKMAAGYVRGMQGKGLAACVKHYAVNSQETRRQASDSIVDERTMREIYLTGFEIAVKEGKPKSLMSSYNKINGEYANENMHVLKEILRDEWGFRGAVVTDWGGSNDHAAGIRAGSSLEMPPAGGDSVREVLRAVKQGTLSEKDVNARAKEVLRLVLETTEAIRKYPAEFDVDSHHAVAREAAEKSFVLLKNEEVQGAPLLPLKKGCTIAVIGDYAKTPRYQGAVSSQVNPTKVDNVLDFLQKESGISITGFAQGFERHGKENPALVSEAVELAKTAEVALLCLSLDEIKESEGLDRGDMLMAESQIALLHAVAAVNPNTVVILAGGSAVETPWLEDVRSLLYIGLSGQAGAGAVTDVLLGRVNPSGKLAETWGMQLSDYSTAGNFPGQDRTSIYKEGPYIGYRYFETAGVKPAFPFGYGLSYTSFSYDRLVVSEDAKSVRFTISNSGSVPGAEIAQLYIGKKDAEIFRPLLELKGFAKVFLNPGESRELEICLDDRAFRYFNVKSNKWEIEGGSYEIMIGASVEDIRLQGSVSVQGTAAPNPYEGLDLPHYKSGKVREVTEEEFAALYGKAVPRAAHPIDRNITFSELNHSRSPIFWIVWAVLTQMKKSGEKKGTPNLNILFNYNMPFRALAKMTAGSIGMQTVDGLVLEAKGFWIIGLIYALIGLIRNLIQNKKTNKELEV